MVLCPFYTLVTKSVHSAQDETTPEQNNLFPWLASNVMLNAPQDMLGPFGCIELCLWQKSFPFFPPISFSICPSVSHTPLCLATWLLSVPQILDSEQAADGGGGKGWSAAWVWMLIVGWEPCRGSWSPAAGGDAPGVDPSSQQLCELRAGWHLQFNSAWQKETTCRPALSLNGR